MPVEVAAGAVVVLSRARVGVSGQDLGVSEWDACVEGVGDGGAGGSARLNRHRETTSPVVKPTNDAVGTEIQQVDTSTGVFEQFIKFISV